MQASDPIPPQLGVPFATSYAALTVAAVTLLAALLVHELSAYSKRRSMPPGPFRWPLIGNALQMPQIHPWLTFSRWARVYGDIFYLDALGQHIVVINSATVARELLDRRSSIYSGRPHLTMVGDLAGYDRMIVMQPYGDELRQQRRLISQTLSTSTIGQYYDIQEAAARRLVLGVIDDPSSLEGQIKMNIASIIMLVTYGYTVKGTEDVFFGRAIEIMDNLTLAARPGVWLADMIPQLKYFPSWMPGLSSLKAAEAWRKLLHTTNGMVYQWCKENSENGTAHLPNLCASVLAQAEGKATLQLEESLMWAALTVLSGGLDTNISTILSFILAMLHYPDVQKKAQAEIDAVVGSGRLPQISDKSSLPYIRSVIAESYRWLPATPLSVPHALDEDDIYDGSFLPKGSIIMPNVWHMLHDPKIYPEPDAFKPERYGGSDIEMKKVTDIAFGFGRRACPGFYFAEGTIFSIVVTVLATCDIVPVVNDHGQEIIPDIRYSTNVVLCPEDVKCTFRPRSEQAKSALIDSMTGVL
uniref:Cytochrome P450 monooxygenase 226 n=2 Tax=Rhodonia placenta TaxID=104341 RepID=CY226_POSPM|nr:RecName: Full=Cytochrome P450 monooxygenase 226 [Postia placenta Mad-698-R]BAK09531.1 cytochrome P450 [Postia placenta]